MSLQYIIDVLGFVYGSFWIKPLWPNGQYNEGDTVCVRVFACVRVCEQCLRQADGVIWFLGMGLASIHRETYRHSASAMSEQSVVRNCFAVTCTDNVNKNGSLCSN